MFQKWKVKQKSEQYHRNKREIRAKTRKSKPKKGGGVGRRRGQRKGKDAELSFLGEVDKRAQGYFPEKITAYWKDSIA